MKNILKIVFSVLSTLIIIVEAALVLIILVTRISGGTPELFGYTVSVVATPSMTPAIKVGDLIVSKVYDGEEKIEVGDIVTFNGRQGQMKGLPITHRVIEIDYNNKTLITKGDANGIDDGTSKFSEIVSVMKYKTVALGFIYKVISSLPGFILLVVLPIIAVITVEIVTFAVKAKEEIKGE